MAKLLFVTQKVDKDDTILGVYHRWIEELSGRVGKINVICLYRGRAELPANVQVFSLGKERNESGIRNQESGIINKLIYAYRFYRHVWRLRREYDVVFVHMNPIYIVLGGLFWKLSGKKILLWYNHPLGGLTARVGICLADKVFCTSPYSFAASYKKTALMPAGVDTDLFRRMLTVERRGIRVLYLGRVSPIKKIEYLIEAARLLDRRNVDFELVIVGSPVSENDRLYESGLKKLVGSLGDGSKVIFRPAVPNVDAPSVYNSSAIFVNLTPTGSFDKTVLESMACETLVMVSNKSFERLLDADLMDLCVFAEGDVNGLAQKIEALLSLGPARRSEVGRRLREIAVRHHSLSRLTVALAAECRST